MIRQKGITVSREAEENTGRKHKGVHLNRLNMLLIGIGLILALLMVISMYETTRSVREIVTLTNAYLSNQQTGGMLRDISEGMSEQAMAFVQSGEPGPAKAYEGQMNTINAQLELYDPEISNSAEADEAFQKAVKAFRARCGTEKKAMRLTADTLPQPVFAALPAFIQETELSEEEQALSPEEKKAQALALLTTEEYIANGVAIGKSVDNSHKLSSEAGQDEANSTFKYVKGIVSHQTIFVALFVLVAVVALVLNRLLIISPIQKSVENLDRREPIPERGSYEMRHLASVYNEVLRDNQRKTEALSYTATHDPLTGVYNRAAFDKMYRMREKDMIGIAVVDVDYFKQYNDKFGHDIGDRVLCEAADALKNHFRNEDYISRIGGDEFCVIMPGTGQGMGEKIREKFREINQELAESNADLPPITLSAGVAFWDRPNPKGSLFKDADSALLKLKKTRDDCCAVYQG